MKSASRKIAKQTQYTKLGKLKKAIAEKINRPAADIYIDNNHLRHIFNKHKAELEQLGLTPKMFVDLVVAGFNRIYEGHRQALMLVLWNGKPKVTVIEMNLAFTNEEFYEVTTATVMSKEFFKNKVLIWKKE
ncbi:MAG: hypothetical protein LBM68_02995 [Bacteroidales bacterium]|nr:hypothetical protein [Bacteroidales bacterium]